MSAVELTQNVKDRFLDLACQLSPENLSCDGELPRAEVDRKYRRLMSEWRQLEASLGRTITEDEVWNWARESHPPLIPTR